MPEWITTAISFLLAMSFAAAWGAHIYEGAVIYPGWASDPPKSLVEWNASPYAPRLAAFFRSLVPILYTVAGIALAVAGLQMLLAPSVSGICLAVSGVCAYVHLTLNIAIFLPTNRKLGFYAQVSAGSTLAPEAAKALLRRWGRWNMVRLGFETTGLIAALLAFKAS